MNIIFVSVYIGPVSLELRSNVWTFTIVTVAVLACKVYGTSLLRKLTSLENRLLGKKKLSKFRLVVEISSKTTSNLNLLKWLERNVFFSMAIN